MIQGHQMESFLAKSISQDEILDSTLRIFANKLFPGSIPGLSIILACRFVNVGMTFYWIRSRMTATSRL